MDKGTTITLLILFNIFVANTAAACLVGSLSFKEALWASVKFTLALAVMFLITVIALAYST